MMCKVRFFAGISLQTACHYLVFLRSFSETGLIAAIKTSTMNILITGASQGIGLETARQLCSEGHTVIAIARSVDKLNRLQQEIETTDFRNQLHTIPFDIVHESVSGQLLPRLRHVVSHIDILIHNAGLLVNKPFEQITEEELLAVYATNVFAPFRLSQQLLPMLKAAGRAHIVHISSMGAVQGSSKFAGLSAYSSSKAALANLTEMLAEELKETGIKVNCLALGAAQTEMLETAFPGYKAPLTAGEMGEFVGWFAVNGHRFFNGKILPVALSTP
jgi:short-subunit dehydrogenase